jgi:hypothetical protein
VASTPAAVTDPVPAPALLFLVVATIALGGAVRLVAVRSRPLD